MSPISARLTSASVFPQELLNAIVEEVSFLRNDSPSTDGNYDPSIHGLTSLALVSRSLRESAHGLLFATVELSDKNKGITMLSKSVKTDRIREFLKLVDADPHSESTGLISRITSFKIQVEYDYEERATLLSNVLSKLFKRKDKKITYPKPCYLTFDGRHNDIGIFGKQFERRLFKLCRNPRLVGLTLRNLYRVPKNILRKTSVQHLELFNVTLASPFKAVSSSKDVDPLYTIDDTGRHVYYQAAMPQTIVMSSAFPIVQLLDMTRNQSLSTSLLFSRLKTLTIKEDYTGSNAHLHSIIHEEGLQSLQFLKLVSLFPYFSHPHTLYPSHKLTNLSTLVIAYGLRIFPETSAMIFAMIWLLLSQSTSFPPALKTIKIEISLWPLVNDKRDAYDWHILDELLSHSRFDSLESISLDFYLDFCHDLDPNRFIGIESLRGVRKQFPLTTAKVRFNFGMTLNSEYPLPPNAHSILD